MAPYYCFDYLFIATSALRCSSRRERL